MMPNFDELRDLEPCPDEEVLRSWVDGRVTDPALQSILSCHVQLCESCRRKLGDYRGNGTEAHESVVPYAEELGKRQAELKNGKAAGPVPGSLWRTSPAVATEAFGPLVMVIEGPAEAPGSLVKVAEVSEDTQRAVQTDMVLEQPESALAFRCMVRAGNVFRLSPEKLVMFAGRLSPTLTEKVIEFCKVAETFDENVPLSEYVFVKERQGTELMVRRGVISGMLVTSDDDPRVRHLDLAKKNHAHLIPAPEESPAKLIDPNRRRRTMGTVLALAAALTGIVVTWQASRTIYEQSLADLRTDYEKKVAREEGDRKKQYGELLALKLITDKELEEVQKKIKSMETRIAQSAGDNPERYRVFSAMSDPMDPMVLEPERGRQILQAIRSRDIVTLKRLLDETESPVYSVAGETRNLPLHWACEEGYLPAVQLLLQKGSPIDGVNSDRRTPLMLAAEKGHRDVVAFLLNKGADPDRRDKDSKSASDLAAAKGHPEVAKLLQSR